jgi:hypothetical protein
MIHRLRVRNYKSIVDVSVDLTPVTVLVGKSGTGKSNFVDSLRFLRDLLAFWPNSQPDWRQIWPVTSPSAFPSFEVEFSIAGIEERFLYTLSLEHGTPFTEQLNLGNECLYHRSNDNWMVEPKTVTLPPPNQIVLRQLPSIPEVFRAFVALTSGIGCYAFSDKVLSRDNPMPTPPPKPTTGLDDEGTNFLLAQKDIAVNLQDLKVQNQIVDLLRGLNPSVSSVGINNIVQPTQIVVGHKLNGKTIPLDLSQESAGFRRFYAHLLALYQKPSKQTLIFEHPEDGIHPAALAMLAEEFKAAPQNARGQVIITTHSPKLLDQFDGDQIRVVELDGFATKIGKVSTEQREAIQDKLMYSGELLTVDPARIEQEAAAT